MTVVENHHQERIIKNTSYLTAAFVVQKVISFLYFVVVARAIGATNVGLYDPVKSLIPIGLILIDFSLSAVLTREIARDPEKARAYLGSVLGVKALFATILLLGLGLATNFSNFSPLVKSIIYLDGLIIALDTFTLTFFAVFRGLQNLKYEAVGMILTQLATVTLGVVALKLGADLRALFAATLAGSALNFTYAFLTFRRRLGYFPRLAWNRQVVKRFLVMALPFAVAAIFVKIYTYTDRWLLLTLAGQKVVGWYVTAHKLTFALEFLPSAYAAAIYPAMSAFFVSTTKELTKTFERALRYLMLLALPISFGIIAIADRLVVDLYGPVFENAATPLRIMIAGLLVIFLNFPVGAFLNAVNRQSVNTLNMGITVVVNILINLLLVRQFTFVGTAIATLVSSILLFSLGIRWVGKIIEYDRRLILTTFFRAAVAATVMAILLWFVANQLPLSVSDGTAIVGRLLKVIGYYGALGSVALSVYVLLLRSMNAISRNDLLLFYHAVKRRFQ